MLAEYTTCATIAEAASSVCAVERRCTPSRSVHQHGNGVSLPVWLESGQPRMCRQGLPVSNMLFVCHSARGSLLCLSPLGGVPASFLSSQQSSTEAVAVKNELKKVGQYICCGPLAAF